MTEIKKNTATGNYPGGVSVYFDSIIIIISKAIVLRIVYNIRALLSGKTTLTTCYQIIMTIVTFLVD